MEKGRGKGVGGRGHGLDPNAHAWTRPVSAGVPPEGRALPFDGVDWLGLIQAHVIEAVPLPPQRMTSQTVQA